MNRNNFLGQLANLDLSHVDRAVALLWYYRENQAFEERSVAELATDLHDGGFGKPNVTRLREELARSKFTVRGKRKGTYQINARQLETLNAKYLPMIRKRVVVESDSVIPIESVIGTRGYLEKMVRQINGTYDCAFYDACAVLCRRLMESLIIETYISRKRQHEIQTNGAFLFLDKLIQYVLSDSSIVLSRNVSKTMAEIKQLGDTAAHDRVYITPAIDIDDVKARFRKLIDELLVVSAIRK